MSVYVTGDTHGGFQRLGMKYFPEQKKMNREMCIRDRNYIGMVNLLCALRDASIISEAEARKIAARLRVETGADVIYPPQ